MTYIITNLCIGHLDQSCIAECPVNCITTDSNRAYINTEECVDCGACEPVCPVDAIYYEDDLPINLKNEIDININFFKE